MEINKVMNHTPHKLKYRVVKKSLKTQLGTSLADYLICHKNIKVKNFYNMIDEVKRFNKGAAAKLEKMIRTKNRRSTFVFTGNLDCSFNWTLTAEGATYWSGVFVKLRQQRDLEFDDVVEQCDLFN